VKSRVSTPAPTLTITPSSSTLPLGNRPLAQIAQSYIVYIPQRSCSLLFHPLSNRQHQTIIGRRPPPSTPLSNRFRILGGRVNPDPLIPT